MPKVKLKKTVVSEKTPMKSDNTSTKKPNVMVSRYTDSLKKDMKSNYNSAEKFMSKNEGDILTNASDKYNNMAANEMYKRGKASEDLYKASLTKLPPKLGNSLTKFYTTQTVVKKKKK